MLVRDIYGEQFIQCDDFILYKTLSCKEIIKNIPDDIIQCLKTEGWVEINGKHICPSCAGKFQKIQE